MMDYSTLKSITDRTMAEILTKLADCDNIYRLTRILTEYNDRIEQLSYKAKELLFEVESE